MHIKWINLFRKLFFTTKPLSCNLPYHINIHYHLAAYYFFLPECLCTQDSFTCLLTLQLTSVASWQYLNTAIPSVLLRYHTVFFNAQFGRDICSIRIRINSKCRDKNRTVDKNKTKIPVRTRCTPLTFITNRKINCSFVRKVIKVIYVEANSINKM